MRVNEMRDMSLQELEEQENQLSEDLFNLRIRHSLSQLDNPVEIRNVRRDLARVKTLLTERRKSESKTS